MILRGHAVFNALSEQFERCLRLFRVKRYILNAAINLSAHLFHLQATVAELRSGR